MSSKFDATAVGTVSDSANLNGTAVDNINSTSSGKSVPGTVKNAIENIQDSDVTQKAVKFADKSIKGFANKVNVLAGGDGEVVLKFQDLFTDVFKRHTNEEVEKIFICGTSQTTPSEKDISREWPKPWLFSRVMLMLFAAFYLLILCWTGFKNINVIPDIIFIGSAIMPMSVLIFLFEMNAPRNLSLITVLKIFFIGGAASLIVTLFLSEIFPSYELDYVGALMVGFVEETGKAIIVCRAIKNTKQCKYIFNGILIGGAVGAGFAVFESAGYAFRIYLSSILGGGELAYSNMINNIYMRGIMSPGGHVAWAAITGAMMMIVTHGDIKGISFIKDKRFISIFLIVIILHGLWDSPLTILSSVYLKIAALIVAAWIVLIVMINNALKEINSL